MHEACAEHPSPRCATAPPVSERGRALRPPFHVRAGPCPPHPTHPHECPPSPHALTRSDASDHFGSCLAPLLPALLASDASLPFAEQQLPAELRGAVLCAHGALTPSFDYIKDLRAAHERAAASRGMRRSRTESFLTMELHGHLFDSGIINQVRARGVAAGGGVCVCGVVGWGVGVCV